MKLTHSDMKWDNITQKLKVGVAIADRQKKIEDLRSNSEIEKIAYEAARRTGQLEGFGDASSLTEQLKLGTVIPDEVFGWSTKTVLAGLLLLMLFKVKKLQGAR